MAAIEPDVRVLLEELGASQVIDYSAMPVEVIRQGFLATNTPPASEPVAEVREDEAPGPDAAVPARVYIPERSGTLPALLYLHGGGFVTGSRETHDAICRALANRARCVVVSPEYRLAPEHRHPAAPEDCYAAARWMAAQAAALGIDPSRIAVAGDSAGGNLAAVTALLCRERGGPALVHQLLVYPVIDAACDAPSQRENGHGYLLTHAVMRFFWQQYLPDPADGKLPTASPCCAPDLSGLPPATVVTAEYDPLRDEGERYARSLEAHGVPAEIRRVPGQIHGFLTWAGRLATGRAMLDEIGARLAEILRRR